MPTSNRSLKLPWPVVYLDQWVWIRLARAVKGRSSDPRDAGVLEAVRAASERGVLFPLSPTHYEETLRIVDPKQRRALADVMAPISQLRTFRSPIQLVRHQFLVALHETVGRPAFRPNPVEVLGVGIGWAFRGVHEFFRVVDEVGRPVEELDPAWCRHLAQFGETEILAGPQDQDLPSMRALGYIDPRSHESAENSRLAWEKLLVDKLASGRPSPAELRVWLLARELSHEYLDLLNGIFAEYRLSLGAIGGVPNTVGSRRRMVSFIERIPTLRIAAEMKLEVFRNTNREWTWNILRDIDALSLAIPYCDVVIADRDAADLVRRTGAPSRYGTKVTSRLGDLPDLLGDLAVEPAESPGEPHGWDLVAAGRGFRVGPPPSYHTSLPVGSRARLIDANGTLVSTLVRPVSDRRN